MADLSRAFASSYQTGHIRTEVLSQGYQGRAMMAATPDALCCEWVETTMHNLVTVHIELSSLESCCIIQDLSV